MLGCLFIHWFWKPLVWRVYVYLHSVTRMCSCASVFLCVTWKWLINFDEKTIFITLHTRFSNWDYWKTETSLKRTLKNKQFQKNTKNKNKKMKTCSCSPSFKKEETFENQRLVWQVYFSNFSSWNIFLYLFADMKVSVLIKHWFLVLKNLNRFSI